MARKEYNCETFGAWYVEEDVFQLKPRDHPVVLSFSCEKFSDFRKDLIQFEYDSGDEFEFREDFDCIRVYGAPDEEKIYIIFMDLEGLSIGFDEGFFKIFCNDVMNFNPEMFFPQFRKLEERKFTRQHMTQKLIKKHQCKRCKGIIVKSQHSMMIANYYGKSCDCHNDKKMEEQAQLILFFMLADFQKVIQQKFSLSYEKARKLADSSIKLLNTKKRNK